MTPFFWVELSFFINETSNGILLAGHTCFLPALLRDDTRNRNLGSDLRWRHTKWNHWWGPGAMSSVAKPPGREQTQASSRVFTLSKAGLKTTPFSLAARNVPLRIISSSWSWNSPCGDSDTDKNPRVGVDGESRLWGSSIGADSGRWRNYICPQWGLFV